MKEKATQSPWNPLCAKCRRPCRQPSGTLLVDCPRFLPYPFKIKEQRFSQMDLFE